MKGYFLTLEGIEGSGKSTVVSWIQEYLINSNVPFIITREPGGTSLGENIRHYLLNNISDSISPAVETLLLFAARAQHLEQVIIPALINGLFVVCDRFIDSTYAYQGGGRGVDVCHLNYLEKWIQKDLQPDKTILLDLPLETSQERLQARANLDRFEQENKSFFASVRAVYLERAEKEKRIIKFDSRLPIDDLQAKILDFIKSLVVNWHNEKDI